LPPSSKVIVPTGGALARLDVIVAINVASSFVTRASGGDTSSEVVL
jgi:hypothetical protein